MHVARLAAGPPSGGAELTGVTDVGLDRQQSRAEFPHLLGGLVQFVASAGQQRDLRAGLRLIQRYGPAEAASGPVTSAVLPSSLFGEIHTTCQRLIAGESYLSATSPVAP